MQLGLTLGGINHTETSVSEVHSLLSRYAADLANRDPRLRDLVEHPSGVWREASVKSRAMPGKGLCIDYDEAFLAGHDSQWIAAMAEIGRDAIRQALLENKDVFVGVMIGEARQGRNYFGQFSQVEPPTSEQLGFFF